MAFKVVVFHPDSHFGSVATSAFRERGCDVISLSETELTTLQTDSWLAECRAQLVIAPLFTCSEAVVRALVATCAEFQVPLLVLTGHEPFNGLVNEGPWKESDLPEPKTPEGEAQLNMERLVLAHARSIILRLPWVVDDPADPLLFRFTDALLAGGRLMVCDRWRGTAVDTQDVVRVVFAMALQVVCGAENWGVYHMHSSDDCSEAEFADYLSRILSKAGATELAEIVTVAQEHRFIRSNGWLAGHRCTNDFGVQLRSWRQGIKAKALDRLSEHSKATGSAKP